MSDIGERADTNGGLGAKCARETKDCNDPDSAKPDSSLPAKPSTTHLCPVDFRGPPLAKQWLLRIFSCACGGKAARPAPPKQFAQAGWGAFARPHRTLRPPGETPRGPPR